jgi:redox-sensing transcriptional repressor
VVKDFSIGVAVITVPAAEAQSVADALVEAGVKGIVNFAPVPLHVPRGVYVEDIDVTMSLEKVAYFARQGTVERDQAK